MANFPLFRDIKAFGIMLIICVLNVRNVRSDSLSPNESLLSIRLIDVETNISPVPALFIQKKTAVIVEGLGWLVENEVARKIDNSFVHKSNDNHRLIHTTYINDREVANGTLELSGYWDKNNTKRFLPYIDAGIIEVDDVGLQSIRVVLHSVLNGDIIESSTTLEVRSHRQWTATIPIFVQFGLFLVFNFHIIHSLFLATFIGSWIIQGSMINGFKAIFDTYLLQAAAKNAHASILLFIIAISTLTTMMKRSGGTKAVLKSLRQHSSKTRFAQIGIFIMGIAIFFDPYVSIMVVGKIFASIISEFPISSEKFSFLIDTTAAPIASIVPKSTWLVFAGVLIQKEFDKITELGFDDIDFANGYSLVLSSIRYQFYPCLVLGLAGLQILTRREMGPILNAENRARKSYNIDRRKSGGRVVVKQSSWNWYIPVVVLNIFLWITFSQMSIDAAENGLDPTFMATSWLISAVATIIITQVIFIFQRKNGKFPIIDDYFDRKERNRIAYLTDTFPSASGSASIPYNPTSKSDDDYLKSAAEDHRQMMELNDAEKAKDALKRNNLDCLKDAPLLNLQEGVACIVHGIATVVPIILSLVFAWTTSSVYIDLGVDRMILSLILNDSLSTEILPVTVFLAAFLLSVIMGSSWCCISILIPGTLVPFYDSLGGDSKVIVLSLASILSGAVAGDHIGPFSETTILSAIVTGIEVRKHFLTQAPYTLFAFILSLLVGTLPVSYNGYPDYVGHIIGIAILVVFVIFGCRQADIYKSSTRTSERQQDQSMSKLSKSMITMEENSNMSSQVGVVSSLGKISEGRQIEDGATQEVILHSPSQQGMEVVEMSMPSIRKYQNLRSFKNKLQQINNEDCDHISGIVEDGLLPNYNFSSELLKSSREKNHQLNEEKKYLIAATIKKAERDGNVFSDSLRTFLRTAEQKLGNILDNNETLEISGSGSADSNGDDSLDNLMMDIAAKGWRKGINNLLGDEATLTSVGEEYTTDGGSTLLESDDSATATSSTLVGHGQSIYFSANGDETSCTSSSSVPSVYSTGTSRLLVPLDFNKSRQSLPLGWEGNEELAFLVDDIFSATDYTKASF